MEIKDFEKAQKELLETVNKFPRSKQSLVFYGDWTIKEVVGHISAWDLYFVEVLKNFAQAKKIDYWGSINKFNEVEIDKRNNVSLTDLKLELEKAGKSFARVYKTIGKDLLNKKIWKNKKYTPQDILKIEIDHYKSQTKEIEKRK